MLAHPNIIALKAVCLEEPNLCLVMEYAAGVGPSAVPWLAGCVCPPMCLSTGPCKLARGMHYLQLRGPGACHPPRPQVQQQ